MKIIKEGNGWLFAKKIYLGDEDGGKINLRLTKGDAVRYGDTKTPVVDFPGEYDIAGISIRCIEAGNVLHYVISHDDAHTAILQSAAALEVAKFDGIDLRVCADMSIKNEIEALEMEGDIQILGEEKIVVADAEELSSEDQE